MRHKIRCAHLIYSKDVTFNAHMVDKRTMAGSRSALPVALAVMAAGLLVAAYALPVP